MGARVLVVVVIALALAGGPVPTEGRRKPRQKRGVSEFGEPNDDADHNTQLVVRELGAFVDRFVEPAVELFRLSETTKNNGEVCFQHDGGKMLRYRCCVFFSNVALLLLADKYSDPPHNLVWPYFDKRTADWEDVTATQMRVTLLYAQFNKWAAGVGTGTGHGIYRSNVKIAGIRGTLTKCEFDTVHTYLVFRSTDAAFPMDDVIVDMTVHQLMVIPDWMTDELYTQVRSGRKQITTHPTPWFVGVESDAKELVSGPKLKHNMQALLGASSPHWSDFDNMVGLMDMLYRGDMREKVCGRPTQPVASYIHPEL